MGLTMNWRIAGMQAHTTDRYDSNLDFQLVSVRFLVTVAVTTYPNARIHVRPGEVGGVGIVY